MEKKKNKKGIIIGIIIVIILLLLFLIKSCSNGEEEKPNDVFYSVTFLNIDGTELQKSDVKEGEMPVYNGLTPTYDDEEYQYTFIGWDKELVVVKSAQVYTATYDKVSKTKKIDEGEVEDVLDYLKFTAKEPNATISLNKFGTPEEISLEISTNKKTWKTYTIGNVIKLNNVNDSVYFRATTNNATFSKNNASFYYFEMTNKISASGNIMSLTDKSCQSKTISDSCIFNRLFKGCESLVTAPELPAENLSEWCYQSMFANCTGLVTAPKLPALVLAKDCYNSMFDGCTNLVNAPELKAESLEIACYNCMFRDCTSLVNAPELPAKSIASYCYNAMFQGCESLVNAPELPSETLADNCYAGMFNGCKNLVNAPELPAKTLSEWCYRSMFRDCESLVTAPELPAETLASDCYNSMFYGCTSLVQAPELPAETLETACYNSMFYGCTSLVNAPELKAEVLTSYCYNHMFNGCESLVTAPKLPAKTLADHCYSAMFFNCTSLQTAPELNAETLNGWCYQAMFKNCTSLTNAPKLPATTLASDCYNSMFYGCTSLKNAPELPAKTLEIACYNSMFRDCTSLESVPMLKATTLKGYCYIYMFAGCTNLTIIPELKVTSIDNYSYYGMFEGCTKIKVHEKQSGENPKNNKIEVVVPNTSGLTNPVNNMFTGTSGAFTGTPTLGKTYILDAYLSLEEDEENANPTYQIASDLKYEIKATNFKTNPTTDSITITYYSDAELKNKVEGNPFTHSVSGTTLTISSKVGTEAGVYYAVVSDDKVTTNPIKINVVNYLKFTAKEANATISLNKTGYPTDISLEISTDGTTWNAYTIGDIINLSNINDFVYFRATTNNATFSTFITHYYSFSMDKEIAASGNIMSLIDKTCESKTISRDFTFVNLFNNCKTLTSAPELPAETLANYCYKYMFGNCKSLVTAPELPAKTLKAWCYNCMFSGCAKLVNAPALPSKTLAEGCYTTMFYGCTSLKNAPVLPAEILKDDCYLAMFRGCTSLVNAPELPSKTLASNCYNSMFMECTSLVNAPALPAKTLADYCYNFMFGNCTSLVTAPELPAETLADFCYYSMFISCTSLVTAPALPAKTLARYCYSSMFRNCRNLTTIPELKATTLEEASYYEMFKECEKVKVHEKQSGENLYNNKIEVFIPEEIDSLKLVVTNMFQKTGGAFIGTPISGKTYILDASLTLTADSNNVNPTQGIVGSLKYTIKATNFKSNPTTGTISLTCYSDAELKNKVTSTPFTYSLSGNTLTISTKTTTEAGAYYVVVSDDVKADPIIITVTDFLKFTAKEKNATIKLNKTGSPDNISLEVSTDGKTWKSYTIGNEIKLNNVNDYVLFRSTNSNSTFSKDASNYYYFEMTKKISASGSVMSLIDNTCKSKTISKNYTFYKLFIDCKTMTTAPKLPAETLASSCYQSMFGNCTSLTTAPALPSKTLASDCYNSMFHGCTSLVNAPTLQAETLKVACYNSMFRNCTSLKNAPALPAKTVAAYCYNYMFAGCTSLVNAPTLQAETLGNYSYSYMFNGCTSLKNAPTISAKTLANYSCYYMFSGCTSLVNVPDLTAETLANNCYQSMFSGCTSLVNAPALPSKSLASDCYNSMFHGCTSLKNAPELPATTLKNACYNSMFRNCTSLVQAPKLPATTLTAYCYNFMFAGCTNLTTISELKATTIANASYNSMFSGCTKLKVHEKQSGENPKNNKVEITIPSTTGLTNPVTDMFKETGGSFSGTPVAGKTYILDYSFTLTEDSNNVSPKADFGGSLKYAIKTTNYKTNPTTDSISITYYSDDELKNKITSAPFTYSVSGSTLTITAKKEAKAGTYYAVISEDKITSSPLKINVNSYLKFTAEEANATLKLNKSGTPYDTSLEICTDGETWNTYTIGETIKLNNVNDYVYFRATTCDANLSKDYSNYYYFSMTNKIAASGNVMSLIDNTCESRDIPQAGTFYRLFYDCKTLTNAPELPATTLKNDCYGGMFSGCTSLLNAPALPAMKVEYYCYSGMFVNCTSLVNAPALPAKSLAGGCYKSMFYGCTSLKNAPELPATTLKDSCYCQMFYGCTSLAIAPELPAKTLEAYCYCFMFYRCTNLTTISELKATSIANYSYSTMFDGCTKLKVHEKGVDENLYNNKVEIVIPNGISGLRYPVDLMFARTGSSVVTPKEGKTYILDASLSITADSNNVNPTQGTVGSLKYTIKATNFKTDPTTETISLTCYSDASLTKKIEGNPFTYTVSGSTLTISTKTTTEGGTYYVVVSDDVKADPITITVTDYLKFTALEKNATIKLNKSGSPDSVSLQTSTDGKTWSNYTIGNTITLTNVNDGVYFKTTSSNATFSKDKSNYYYFSMTNKVSASGSVMSLIDSTCKSKTISKNYTFYKLFNDCKTMTTAPKLPAETLANYCYQSMFGNCISLVTAPELPSKTLANDCYNSMFYGCSSLVNAPELPATTLKGACYNSMFRNCTSLVIAPNLPAKTLAAYCYNYMFAGCTSLTTISELKATTLVNAAYNSMFNGCTKLKVHEKQSGENQNNNRIEITIPSITGLTNPVTDMFKGTGGSFTGTPVAGKTYILDAYLEVVADESNAYPSYGTAGSLKYEIKATNFKTNPTTESISITYYSDAELKNKITNAPFTYSVSGSTLTITSKEEAEVGTYYAVVSDDVKADPIEIGIVEYLKFTAEEANATVSLGKIGSPDSISLQTSTDGKTWSNYAIGTTIKLNNVNDSVFFKATTNNATFGTSSSDYYQFTMTNKIAANGNVMSLIDATCESKTISNKYTFAHLFYNCKTLTTAPKLPAETLAEACYQDMFSGCTSLVNAPELPANKLAYFCYQSMFWGCTSLVNAPELKATTLAGYCYNYMFYGCTSLVTAPELPAESLAACCYWSMFKECKSLVAAPELPAKTLTPSCYQEMFWGCTKLKVHEKQSGENSNNNKIEITIPSTTGLLYPVTDMFKGTGGSFTGTPVAGKTYILDAYLEAIEDESNVYPSYGTVGSLKYTLKATNFKTNPTADTISIKYYSDAELTNEITDAPFTYTLSGSTLTISSKSTTSSGTYYAVLSDDIVKANTITIVVTN